MTIASNNGFPSLASSSLSPAEEREIRSLLGQGAYHLPGNEKWWQDWLQLMRNNHPLLALCFQSYLHPITKGMRAVGLVGSVMMGLVITNCIFMWQLYEQRENEEAAVFRLSTGELAVYDGSNLVFLDAQESAAVTTATQNSASFEISSQAMIVLWTVGSAAHALFDSFIWYVTSCSCCGDCGDCRYKSWMDKGRNYCNVLVVILVVMVTAVATLAVVIRAMIEKNENSDAFYDALTDPNGPQGAELQQLFQDGAEPLSNKDSYGFLEAYAVELALSWFAFFPLLETIFFSGILSCGGRIPFFGGRPAELKQEHRRKEQARRRESRRAFEEQRRSATNSSTGKKKKLPPPSTSIKKANGNSTKSSNNKAAKKKASNKVTTVE
mmetsp:Transcript_26328/g.43254  ORF Transcript_26328/g.43254 Transcript_26328/m.43254 type:complete len:382 (+) Transcript_26328:91-1236(+)